MLKKKQSIYELSLKSLTAEKDVINRQLDKLKLKIGITKEDQLLKLIKEVQTYLIHEKINSFIPSYYQNELKIPYTNEL